MVSQLHPDVKCFLQTRNHQAAAITIDNLIATHSSKNGFLQLHYYSRWPERMYQSNEWLENNLPAQSVDILTKHGWDGSQNFSSVLLTIPLPAMADTQVRMTCAWSKDPLKGGFDCSMSLNDAKEVVQTLLEPKLSTKYVYHTSADGQRNQISPLKASVDIRQKAGRLEFLLE